MADAGRGRRIGLHVRGPGPGDRVSLPYFAVPDHLAAALHRVRALGREVIRPGERWAICRDSEGSPFRARAGGRRRLTSANRPDRRPSRRWPYGSQSCWRLTRLELNGARDTMESGTA